MARAYRDHPFIVVPGVVPDLCRERVIVSEFIEGDRFADAKLRSQTERDRLGEILVRFYVSGPMRHRLLNGDPHPGNALFLADGRVAFLDFGFFKRLADAEITSLIAASTRAVHAGDAEKLMEVMVAMGALRAQPGARPAVPRGLRRDPRLDLRRGGAAGRRHPHRRDDAPLQPAAGRMTTSTR